MEFSEELRGGVLAGDISVSFRLWKRARVKDQMIEVDSIELVPFSAIDDADLQRSGEDDLESIRARAAHAAPIHDDTLLFRIEFHLVPIAR